MFEDGERLKDISDKLNINYNTIKQWKSRDNWMKPVTCNQNKKVTKKVTDKKVTEDKVIHNESDTCELTEKQKLFCEIYVKNFNATQAAIKAGYSPNCARQEGYRQLTNVHVKDYINSLKELKKQSIMINEDDIIERYMRIAFSDITDFMEFGSFDVPIITEMGVAFDGDGNIVTRKENGLRLKSSDVVDGGLVSEIKTSKQGTSLKLKDSNKALSWLANYFGMNPEHKMHKEFGEKKQQLERERFEFQKDIEEKKVW